MADEELKPFAIASIKKHLKAITKSNNYFAEIRQKCRCGRSKSRRNI